MDRIISKYEISVLVQNIHRIRCDKGLSAQQLSLSSGLSHGYVANLEAGKYRDISVKVVYALSTALGISSAELLGF